MRNIPELHPICVAEGICYDHYNITGYTSTVEYLSIVGRQEQRLARSIKETILIGVNDPSLNGNISEYHLPHIWDEALHNPQELKFS